VLVWVVVQEATAQVSEAAARAWVRAVQVLARAARAWVTAAHLLVAAAQVLVGVVRVSETAARAWVRAVHLLVATAQVLRLATPALPVAGQRFQLAIAAGRLSAPWLKWRVQALGLAALALPRAA
jgi:hypothetical protein